MDVRHCWAGRALGSSCLWVTPGLACCFVLCAACMRSRGRELPTLLVPAWAGTWGCTWYDVGRSTRLCCALGLLWGVA
eukprot:3938636-Rhodomonas_salina.1